MTANLRRLSACVALALIPALPAETGAGQQPTADPFVGAWILNVAKSKYTPGPTPKSGTITITMQGKTVTVMMDGVSSTGTVSHWMYSAAADGKDYPASGNPDVDAVALKQVDARTVEAVQKKGGKPTLTVRRVVAADGRTMTVTSTGTNAAGVAVSNVAVYDRKG